MARGTRPVAVLGALVMALALAVTPAAPAVAAPVQDQQWYLKTLRIAEAHKITTGQGVVVAVLEDGVQADHPDLAGQVLDGVRITGDDDKGKVDHLNHGTGVAGLIAAKGGGPDHLLGIAPGAKILPVGTGISNLGGTDLHKAIPWAVDHGAKVINISMGGPRTTDKITDAIRYALDHDVVIIAGAGNVENDTKATKVIYPAATPGVLAVSGVDRQGAFWSGSMQGPEVGISAPGVDIMTLSNRPPGSYMNVAGGTSASTAIVSGAAALVRAKYPRLRAKDVIARLVNTADDAGPAGRDPQYGFGRLNIVRALTADVPTVAANPLGYTSASPSPSATASGALDRTVRQLLIIGGAAVGVVLLLVLVIVLVLVGRARRRRAAGGWSVRVTQAPPPPPTSWPR